MPNYDEEEEDNNRAQTEKKDKTVREQFRQLAIETLKRKKISEGVEMARRKIRVAELKRRQARLIAQKMAKSQAAGVTKKFAAQVVRQAAMFVLRIIATIIASFGFYILIALLVILIIAIVIAAINYLCESTWLGQTVCNIFL